jgi:hypothetical protein
MTDSHPILHAALLHGVRQPSDLRECVRAFAEANARAIGAAPIAIFAGDEIEKGQAAPDRRHDLVSGSPLFLVLTQLAPGVVDAGTQVAPERLGYCSSRIETWLLRERFAHVAQRTGDTHEAWLQIIMMNIDPSVEGEFNEWYEQEHALGIASVAPEFVSVRRLEAIAGSPRYHAYWRLTDFKGPERDPWLSASDTPWTRRLRRFNSGRRRLLMAPLTA